MSLLIKQADILAASVGDLDIDMSLDSCHSYSVQIRRSNSSWGRLHGVCGLQIHVPRQCVWRKQKKIKHLEKPLKEGKNLWASMAAGISSGRKDDHTCRQLPNFLQPDLVRFSLMKSFYASKKRQKHKLISCGLSVRERCWISPKGSLSFMWYFWHKIPLLSGSIPTICWWEVNLRLIFRPIWRKPGEP